MYYGRVEVEEVVDGNTHRSYCREGIRKCVQCPENRMKTVSGNSESLCVDNTCDGTKTVMNREQSGCGKRSLKLLAFIALLAAQSHAQICIHGAIFLIDTSNNALYNQVHWLVVRP